VVDKVGAIPQRGALVEADGVRLQVQEVEGQRVRKVLITRTSASEPDQERAHAV
jgi:CBS domain containing-hemolysin-like protein